MQHSTDVLEPHFVSDMAVFDPESKKNSSKINLQIDKFGVCRLMRGLVTGYISNLTSDKCS